MDGTNTYMPVMPAGGMNDFGGSGWWIILLFLSWDSETDSAEE